MGSIGNQPDTCLQYSSTVAQGRPPVKLRHPDRHMSSKAAADLTLQMMTPMTIVPPAHDAHIILCLFETLHKSSSNSDLASDDTHDHGLRRCNQHMMQPHGPEQAVSPGKACISMHQEGCALHEWPQINVHAPLFVCQVSAGIRDC